VVEGAGHFLHHDRPDHVARLVLQFADRIARWRGE